MTQPMEMFKFLLSSSMANTLQTILYDKKIYFGLYILPANGIDRQVSMHTMLYILLTVCLICFGLKRYFALDWNIET